MSERQWRSAANRSPLPLRSVLDGAHWAPGPEPAGETGVGIFRKETPSGPAPPGHLPRWGEAASLSEGGVTPLA